MTADREHVHHRLIDMGFDQKQSVMITYMLSALLGLAAVVLTGSGEVKALLLLGSIFIVGGLGFWTIFSGRKEKPDPEQKETTEHEET